MANLLFIFEGESTEHKITKSLSKYYINERDNIIIQTAFCSSIYDLHSQIFADDDLDTFRLIKSKEFNKERLKGFRRNDFAEIYLFFDYDGHAHKAEDKKLIELLDFFNEETDNGKLYLSYPMVESLIDIPVDNDFEEVVTKISELKNYKSKVNTETLYSNMDRLSRPTWNFIIVEHLKKMNFIVNDIFEITPNFITQSLILKSQISKFIEPSGVVSVLCAFPIFIRDYYGIKLIRKMAS